MNIQAARKAKNAVNNVAALTYDACAINPEEIEEIDYNDFSLPTAGDLGISNLYAASGDYGDDFRICF